MLKVDGLTISGLPLLSFDVMAGECLAIEGPSGSGKTRILRAIADLDPAGGHVFLEGAERGEMPGYKWRQQVRYVSAEPAWWEETARQHVPGQAESQRFERTAHLLGVPDTSLDAPISQLSTGERLRLGLARAIADEPRVLLLDEPTSALDGQAAALTEELIRFQILSRRCVILVSHDASQISRLAQHSLQLGAPPSEPTDPGSTSSTPATDDRLQRLAQHLGQTL